MAVIFKNNMPTRLAILRRFGLISEYYPLVMMQYPMQDISKRMMGLKYEKTDLSK